MNKENNKSAAGLRRSAVAERIRLREEWLMLKGPEAKQADVIQKKNILTKKQTNAKTDSDAAKNVVNVHRWKESTRNMRLTNDTLRGVVALVEVGAEGRALPLRAALTALGASVLPAWNPLVTHLVWSQGGCRATRAKARALACRLVSPLWVEACAAASRRLPEHAFPAAARASDLPSPRTLRRLLKKAEMENIPISELLSDTNEENQKLPRLRISSDTEQDTSADITDTSKDTSQDTSKDTSRDASKDTSLDATKDTTRDASKDTSRDASKDTSRDTSKDTSRDASKDTSRDTSKDTTNDTSIESRVNTAPRRALPKTLSVSPPPRKSRRKLFTHKETDIDRGSDDSDDTTTVPRPPKPSLPKKTTQPVTNQPKLPPRRELARAERMAKKLIASCTPAVTQSNVGQARFRIVLTGMSRTERSAVTHAVKTLNGRIQRAVDKRTTHVILGSCTRDDNDSTGLTEPPGPPPKPRTASALAGAARGCRVLRPQWPLHSAARGGWLHHTGYEVTHLAKISQKARVERLALGKQRSEYAYDVFNGMRVRISKDAAQREAAVALLRLCGAVVMDEGDIENNVQNGGRTQPGALSQNGGRTQQALTQNGQKSTQYTQRYIGNGEYDIKIGNSNGEISSKWVFDSVAAGRMRTTRRYVINSLSESDLVTQMERFQC